MSKKSRFLEKRDKLIECFKINNSKSYRKYSAILNLLYSSNTFNQLKLNLSKSVNDLCPDEFYKVDPLIFNCDECLNSEGICEGILPKCWVIALDKYFKEDKEIENYSGQSNHNRESDR